VVEELVPNLLNLGTVLRVIKNLLKESVSVRDLRTILETLADYSAVTKDPDILTEFVRQGLGRYIVEQYKREDDVLFLLTLDREVEEVISESVQITEQGSYLAIEPGMAQKIINNIRLLLEKFEQSGTSPVLISSPNIRRHVKFLTERFIPNLAVLSHNEIPPHIKIQSFGVVSVDAS
jgi:flagellar biosynthesis protein FlhA